MSRLKRIRTRINKENLERAQKEGHITEEQAQEVIDTNGLYNPYTDTYINPDILPEISVTAKAPERTWTSEWTYNDPEFRLAREHRNIAAQEVAKSTRDKMNQVGNSIGKTIIGGTSFTPLWFAAPIAKAGIATSEGDYSGAAKEAAVGLLAPYAIGKGLEKGYRVYQTTKPYIKGVINTTSKNTLSNRITHPVETIKFSKIYSDLDDFLKNEYTDIYPELKVHLDDAAKNVLYKNGLVNKHAGVAFNPETKEISGLSLLTNKENSIRAHEYVHNFQDRIFDKNLPFYRNIDAVPDSYQYSRVTLLPQDRNFDEYMADRIAQAITKRENSGYKSLTPENLELFNSRHNSVKNTINNKLILI